MLLFIFLLGAHACALDFSFARRDGGEPDGDVDAGEADFRPEEAGDADMPDTTDEEDARLDPDPAVDVPADDGAADTQDFQDTPFDPDDGERGDMPDAPGETELPPGLAWVSIPAGSFDMGCSAGDGECDANESPRHRVNVSAFLMTETEITQAQYEWVTGSSPSHFSGCPDCPVEQVDWNEARAFCESVGGRLPSEAEWEYAARGNTTTRYYCGDDAACLEAAAWYIANSGSTTHSVGEKTANAFGLLDMLGNVWEWVEDCWHEDYTDAPSTGEVWSGGDCSYRVLRGSSCNRNASFLRVSLRFRIAFDFRNWYTGFRCVRDAT